MSSTSAPRILLVIPCSLFLLSVLLTNASGPYYQFGNFDPDYCYLFNALNILTFHPPGHWDHPGTTLQLLGAIVVLGKWLGSSLFGVWMPISKAVLSDPESYLHAINLAINFLICSTAYVASREIYRISKSLPAALAPQVSVLLFEQTLLSQIRVSVEP